MLAQLLVSDGVNRQPVDFLLSALDCQFQSPTFIPATPITVTMFIGLEVLLALPLPFRRVCVSDDV